MGLVLWSSEVDQMLIRCVLILDYQILLCKLLVWCQMSSFLTRNYYFFLVFSREMKSARNCKVYYLLYCASVTHHSVSERLFLLSEVLYVICIFNLFKLKSTDDINFSNVWLLTNQIKFFLQFKNLHSWVFFFKIPVWA